MLRSRFVSFALTLGLATTSAVGAAADDKPKPPSAAQLKTFADSLAAGRKAVKAKDYKAAITHLEAAQKIVPQSPSMLGELGWALFLDEQYDKAYEATQSAVLYSNRAKQLGALHYNLGRIEEARGKKEEARSEYTESLGYRDNDTVKKRVAALGGPLKKAELVLGHTNFVNAIADAGGIYCAKPVAKEKKTEDDNCSYEVKRSEAVPGGGIEEFRIVHLDGYADEVGGSVDADLLLVRTGKYWFGMGIVADSYTPGVDYITNNGQIDSVQVTDALPGLPGSELLIQSTNGTVDHDPGVEETSSGDERSWWLCGLVAKKATCVELRQGLEWSINVLGENWEAGKQLDGGKWSTDIAVKDDQVWVTTSGKATDLPPAQQACLGGHSVSELITKACATTRVAK